MTVSTIAIVGAGTMGGGIAIGCLAAGMATTVVDTTDEALDRLKARVDRYFNRLVEKGRLSAADAETATALLTTTTDLTSVAGSDLVIEAVFEDLEVKRALFRRLSPFLAPETLVATNTSALRVADLAESLPVPERFLGLHYFSPAEVNPVVEVVSGPATAADVLASAREFLVATGKTALSCRDSNGFAVNRFFCPYTNEAARLLDEGLGTPATIDAVAQEGLGVALGPFAVMNIIKPRINLNAIRNLGSLGAFYAPAASMITTGEADTPWEIAEGSVALAPDAEKTIADRLRMATFLPVLQAIEEDVAAPEAFDQGARLALRFGKPPVALMRELGREAVTALVAPACAHYGVALPERGLDKVFGQ